MPGGLQPKIFISLYIFSTRKMISSGGVSLRGYILVYRPSCTNTKKDKHAYNKIIQCSIGRSRNMALTEAAECTRSC